MQHECKSDHYGWETNKIDSTNRPNNIIANIYIYEIWPTAAIASAKCYKRVWPIDIINVHSTSRQKFNDSFRFVCSSFTILASSHYSLFASIFYLLFAFMLNLRFIYVCNCLLAFFFLCDFISINCMAVSWILLLSNHDNLMQCRNGPNALFIFYMCTDSMLKCH